MVASKNTRRFDPGTNELFQSFFQNGQVSEERERAWHDAVRHAGTGTPPLRFPIHEYLYFLNVYAEKTIDLLKEVNSRFGLNQETSLYDQSLIQYVRASASRELLKSMTGIEHTDAWLFESQRKLEEKSLRDPDVDTGSNEPESETESSEDTDDEETDLSSEERGEYRRQRIITRVEDLRTKQLMTKQEFHTRIGPHAFEGWRYFVDSDAKDAWNHVTPQMFEKVAQALGIGGTELLQ